jgi:hypothetical protein
MTKSFDEDVFLESFVHLLKQRLELGGLRSEDGIRYTFFYALTEAGYEHWQIQLEEPLPTYKGRKLDLRALDHAAFPCAAAEFKFHRERASTLPKPQLAGGLFGDLARLAIAHHSWECRCYFVYVTDHTMMTYLKRDTHGCADLVCTPKGGTVAFGPRRLKGLSRTFVQSTNGFLEPGTAVCVTSSMISCDYELRVFRVEHTPDAIYDWR